MTCLLCGQHLKSNLTFSNLLLLKKEETSVCVTCSESFERIGEEHCPNCHKKECQLLVKTVNFGVKKGLM